MHTTDCGPRTDRSADSGFRRRRAAVSMSYRSFSKQSQNIIKHMKSPCTIAIGYTASILNTRVARNNSIQCCKTQYARARPGLWHPRCSCGCYRKLHRPPCALRREVLHATRSRGRRSQQQVHVKLSVDPQGRNAIDSAESRPSRSIQ